MGSSFVEYRGHGFWSRDGFIEDWLRRLVREIDADPAPAEWLRQARHQWHLQATSGFNGCIDCSFDELLSDGPHREHLLELALRVQNQTGMTRGESTTAEQFLRLLRGEITTTAASPIDYLARN